MAKEGEEREDHKYVARILNPKGSKTKYRYFYELSEWSQYLKTQKTKSLQKNQQTTLNGKATNGLNDIKITDGSDKQDGKVTNAINFVKQLFTKNPPKISKKFDNLTRINPNAQSNEQHQKTVNPMYSEFDSYTTNCASCAVAYDLRKRGYDVVAAPAKNWDLMDAKNTERPSPFSVINDWYEPPPKYVQGTLETSITTNNFDFVADETSVTKAVVDISSVTKDIPNGARGILSVRWAGYDSGHAMAWEKEDEKIVVRDCQTNKTHSLEDILSRSSYYAFVRTDDVTPQEVCLTKVIDREEFEKAEKEAREEFEHEMRHKIIELGKLQASYEVVTNALLSAKAMEISPIVTEEGRNRASMGVYGFKTRSDDLSLEIEKLESKIKAKKEEIYKEKGLL